MYCISRHAAVLAIGALAVGLAHAGGGKTVPPATAPAAAAPAASGLKIYVDPATGAWSSTPVTEEQKRQAAAQVDTFDPSKVETINHADGSIEYRTNGQMVDYLVATRAADGTLKVTCSQHGLEPGHAPVTTTTTTTTTAAGGRDDR